MELGDDPENDLRRFKSNWLEEKFEKRDMNFTDFGDVYDVFYNNWDVEDVIVELTESKYKYYNELDILNVDIEDRDKTNATFVITVNGNAKKVDYGWLLCIWCNCTPDNNPFVLIAILDPEYEDEFDFCLYIGYYKEEFIINIVDFDSSGSKINIDFPSDWIEDVEDCGLKIFTSNNEEDAKYLYVDIYPGIIYQESTNWWWIVIILVISLISTISIYLFFKIKK